MMTKRITFATHQPTRPGGLVGIVADSHGQAERLKNALAYLKKQGCSTCYHLGDICDSLNPGSADACVQVLRSYRVNAVKGNNDHTLVVNQNGRANPAIGLRTLEYLRELPLVCHHGRLVLTHSLPFQTELGLSCMVGVMQASQAISFFQRFPGRVLVRGHSHAPEIIRQNAKGGITSEAMPLEQAIRLDPQAPAIVTCGAVDRDLCLMWSPEDGSLVSRRFR